MVTDRSPRDGFPSDANRSDTCRAACQLRCAVPGSGHETAPSIPEFNVKSLESDKRRGLTYGVPKLQKRLPQLCGLGLGLHQDGDVGVGVFPKGKEIVVCGARFGNVG